MSPTEDAVLNKKIEETAEYIRQNGVDSKIVVPKDSDMTREKLLPSMAETVDIPDILFLTDSERIADYLTCGGAFVVGIIHENNKTEDFSDLKYVFSDIDDVDFDSYLKAYQRYAHLPWKILETDRCIVRETTVEDVDSFYEIYADPEMTRYMEGLFEDPADERKYTADYIEKVYGLMGFGTWTVIEKASGNIIGRAGFSIRNGFDDIELGFLIGTKYQRQGFAYEVCSAIIDYGTDVLQFERLQALVKAENAVSIHLLEKLGFRITQQVQVEENIYGDNYTDGLKVPPSKAQYGRYVMMQRGN